MTKEQKATKKRINNLPDEFGVSDYCISEINNIDLYNETAVELEKIAKDNRKMIADEIKKDENKKENHLKETGYNIAEETEYKGNKILILNPGSRFTFSFGVGKAKMIMQCLDDIKKFIHKNDVKNG